MAQTIKHYFGIKTSKFSVGDFSLGAHITYDSWLQECYLYLNLGKWSIAFGYFSKL